MKERQTQEKMEWKRYSKKELQAREEAMNHLHPEFFDLKLKLQIMLGAVLFGRGFHAILAGMLGLTDPFRTGVNLVSVLVAFCYYQMFLMGTLHVFHIIILITHVMEFAVTLLPFLTYIFHMNQLGIIWLLVYSLSMILDIGFLGFLLIHEDAKTYMRYNRKIHSDQTIDVK